MNATPRLRSAWPKTPQSRQKDNVQEIPAVGAQTRTSSMPDLKAESAPAIPFSLVDAPSQRFYISFLYIGLTFWRIFDYSSLSSDGTDGFWFFTKWVGIDTAFLYGMSGLNIPWLQWSSHTFTALFVGHALANWMLMFQIPIPLFAWIGTLTKAMYDREYAVSERYVKPASILHNSSVIMGKQIIHILPEGSVMMNPEQVPYCIGGSKTSADLQIIINQTVPIHMDIIRIDLDTNEEEIIGVSAKELRKMQKTADIVHGRADPGGPRVLRYPVKQPGLYRLQSMIDESKLEVQKRPSDALVVQCPSASIEPGPQDKCIGELSDFYLLVDATPPFKIKYSKTINRDDHGHSVLSIPSDNSMSPLSGQGIQGVLVPQNASALVDVSWARLQHSKIPLNESLGVAGGWQYTIDEVHDACGNIANYSDSRIPETYQRTNSKFDQLERHFSVHERPRLSIKGFDTQHPIKVEEGRYEVLPLQFITGGIHKPEDLTYTIKYLFTPQSEMLPDQQHPASAIIRESGIFDDGDGNNGIVIDEPGLYSLLSVHSPFCDGEILEPSSCQLMNPLQPDLNISSEQIPDRCAGNSIGLVVDLDLMGTPPFRVHYTIKQSGGSTMSRETEVNRFHTQLELKPFHAGHYTYEFERISDAVYRNPRSLSHKGLVLQQDVKPPASARFLEKNSLPRACIEEPLSFWISLSGESPYTIEYELLHRGRRVKRTVENAEDSMLELVMEPLMEGGDYTLALMSVTDATTCRRSLDAEVNFSVSLQRPRAGFGLIDGTRDIFALENKRVRLPLRLQGEPPWIVKYSRADDPAGRKHERVLGKSNAVIEVDEEGQYEILAISDASCPGSVDASAKNFAVRWIPRPRINLVESSLVAMVGGLQVKKPVCEGDEDSTEFSLSGTAPFNVEYEQRWRPERGSQSTTSRSLTAGLDAASILMETSEAGLYTYHFSKLGDASYSHDGRRTPTVDLQQRVYPRPSAVFAQAGKTYKYCKEERGGGEMVPITLTGSPPFHLELEIKHLANAKPERINLPNIESNRYNLHLPHRVLALGSHSVTIRKVQDSQGCQRAMDFNAPQVQVTVAEIPSISPLEEQIDFCVGDRISYALSGTPPFNVFYTFQGLERKAKVPTTDFRRIAEQPGEFVITAVSDARSTDACKARIEISKSIHEMPSVRISRGRTSTVDIHEGGEAEILFEFGGTPPFHFTYTRSTTPTRGKKALVLETKNGVSHDYSMTIRASDEGTYEVVSIRDKFCAFSSQQIQGKSYQRLLKNG